MELYREWILLKICIKLKKNYREFCKLSEDMNLGDMSVRPRICTTPPPPSMCLRLTLPFMEYVQEKEIPMQYASEISFSVRKAS